MHLLGIFRETIYFLALYESHRLESLGFKRCCLSDHYLPYIQSSVGLIISRHRFILYLTFIFDVVLLSFHDMNMFL